MSRTARWVVALALLAGAATTALAETAPPEPNNYRDSDYRAPVPRTLRGARVVTTAEAEALWKAGAAVFIDVLPRPPKPKLPPDTLWRDEPRPDIPGSLWLPDTGYGVLPPQIESYFRAGLAKATDGNRDRTVVIYCLRNCWMSWNAARRALAMGYTRVVWYPDGTDGWGEAGLPLKEATPEPRPSD